jgi:hypothetical protein
VVPPAHARMRRPRRFGRGTRSDDAFAGRVHRAGRNQVEIAIVRSLVGPNVRAGIPAGFGDEGSLRPGRRPVIRPKAEPAATIR